MAAASILSLDVPCSGSSTILRSVRKTLELRLRKKRRWREGGEGGEGGGKGGEENEKAK